MNQVSFSYPTRADEVAIREVSVLFPAGETVFVIGKSGSGKSTLGQLLVRFYQPSSGQILLDDVPLNSLDVQWLRSNITLVEQHSVLFNDTIRQNLALGNPTKVVSSKETSDAIDFALLSQVVQELPEGLDTHLGMKGSSLSGGQRQRLALARANIRDTPILILDESTSALDYITRATILQATRNWRRGKTTIIITHDISQIESDDFLYLFDNAELHEKGYRRDLETKFSLFHSLLVSYEKEDINGEYLSEDESSDDELMPTYDRPWDVPSPRRRPLSAIMFGESVISPLLTSASKRLSSYERENNPEEATRSFLAVPGTSGFSAEFGSAVNDVELKEYGSKRSSIPFHLSVHTPNQQAPAYPPLQRSHSRTRSRPPSRSDSRPNSRPVSMLSRENSYPRRLSVVSERVAPLDSNDTRWRRTRFRRKTKPLDTRKSAEEQVTSPGSLGIREILRTVWPNVNWKSRVTLIVGVFATFIHAAATPVFSWVFSQLLTTLYTPEDQRQEAIKWALIILAIAILDGVSSYLMFYLFDQVAQSWTQALKVEAMKRILAQPREFFNKEENSITRITEVLDHSAEEARNLPGRFAGVFLAMFFMIVISVLWTLSICWKLALVALASGPILYGITQVYNMIASHWERLVSEADDNVAQVLNETFVNIRTVRCLTLEDVFRKKYEEVTTSALNVGLKRAIYSGSIFGLNMSGPLFVAVALFWYGAYVVSRNEYSVPAITETFLILMLSINHISQMSNYMTQMNISREAGSRLIRLVRLPASSHEEQGTVKVESAGDISFKNLNFAYPNRREHPILHNLSLSIARGSCTAIVGSSGSGKSTVAALLLKLYPIDQRSFGSTRDLTVSNYDIKALHTTTLRSKMAMVSQTPVLFPGTIADNIAYGLSPSSPQATLASIRAAGEAAGVSEFIDSLPQGYQTIIGDGGTNLSGGQAQRVAIARALVRDPDVLILDEATSALDVLSANVVRETIQRLVAENKTGRYVPGSRAGGVWNDKEMEGRGKAMARKQMTVIIITHAREMMMIADQIIMLDKGRVIEEGSFSELKKKKGGAFGRLLRGEAE
jgi:ATP-binding cassette subfamily B (MDR/TAP) protein 1